MFTVLLQSCTKQTIPVHVECIIGDTLKYEFSNKHQKSSPDSLHTGLRILNCSFPASYGFTDIYKSEDGDYLDVFLFTDYPVKRDTVVEASISHIILMRDQQLEDSKLVCFDYIDNKYDYNLDEVYDFLGNYSGDVITVDSVLKVSSIIQAINSIADYTY